MAALRHMLGLTPPAPHPMTDEQELVAERLDRIAKRQRAIDIQVDVLQADRADLRRSPRR
jgi:hypothetical protein